MACPVCKKPTDPDYRPFCCKRCADVDLHRWMTGSYVMPGEALSEEDEIARERDDPER